MGSHEVGSPHARLRVKGVRCNACLGCGSVTLCDEPYTSSLGRSGTVSPQPRVGKEGVLSCCCLASVLSEHVFTRTGCARSSPNSAHGTQPLIATALHTYCPNLTLPLWSRIPRVERTPSKGNVTHAFIPVGKVRRASSHSRDHRPYVPIRYGAHPRGVSEPCGHPTGISRVKRTPAEGNATHAVLR